MTFSAENKAVLPLIKIGALPQNSTSSGSLKKNINNYYALPKNIYI